jgi:hypothetical protein
MAMFNSYVSLPKGSRNMIGGIIFRLSCDEDSWDMELNSQTQVDVLNQAVCGLFVIQDRAGF